MPITPDWRSDSAADALERLGRAGFAQEFLRRNHDYRRDYRRMARLVGTGAVSEDDATLALARRWGLSFPVRSDLARESNGRLVAAHACS